MMPTPRDRRNTKSHGSSMDLSDMSSDAVLSAYFAHQRSAGRWRPRTLDVRGYQLRWMAECLAPKTLLQATEDDIVEWHATIDGRPETIASYTSAARGLYRWMATKARPRLRIDDPTLVLERPKIPQAQPRPMPNHHYDLALACAVAVPEMYLWLGLMGCSGLRCCEIAWLQTTDIEVLPKGGGLLHITGKGGRQRTTPAGEMLMLTLQPFLMRRGSVFTRPDGRPHTPHGVSSRANRFLRGLGITETAHSLRHRFGTDYHALDADLFRQAKLMGHASVVTTQLYTEIHPIEAAQYVERLTRQRLHPEQSSGTQRGRSAA